MKSLSERVKKLPDLFLVDGADGDDTLPSHRMVVDTRVAMQKDDQDREKEVPWGSFYGISRDELLVLRKTLTELLEKSGSDLVVHREAHLFCS